MILGRKVLQDFELQQTVEVCMKIRKLVNLLPSWKNLVIWRSKEISSNIWWSILEWVSESVVAMSNSLWRSCMRNHVNLNIGALSVTQVDCCQSRFPTYLSLTNLIVEQKQVTVGLPPHQEAIISHPLGAIELRDLIYSVHQADISTAVLTQELLSYLAMFIRTEPNLFHGMIRIRVGLIIQVLCVSRLLNFQTIYISWSGNGNGVGENSQDWCRGSHREIVELVSIPDQEPAAPHHVRPGVRSVCVDLVSNYALFW